MRIGKITENALRRSVLKQIRTEYKNIKSAAVGTDCAFSDKENSFSTTCPVALDATDKGFYAVVKAANSLIAQGIRPDHVSLSILLPPDAEESELKRIVSDAIDGCRICGTVYGGGHTEVTGAVNRSVVVASAFGTRQDGDSDITALQKPVAGQMLVVTKWIGLEGTAILSGMKKDELVKRYPVPFVEEAASFRKLLDIRTEAQVISRFDSCSVHDISGGGIMAALWEMSERAGCGLMADLKKIPIRQETIEICEFFEINPYLLASAGSLLISCDDAERIVYELENVGVNAAVIGSLTEGNDKLILNDEDRSFLQLPQSDEILKILG